MRPIFHILFLLLCYQAPAWSQQDSVAQKLFSFVRNIQTFNHLYPQEKVWLHFDNTGYYLNETIWFKAYVVNASTLRVDTLSRVLYVELLNPLGKVLETKKLKIEDGQCHGDFQLTVFNYEYLAGFYEIRAYTRAMLNFDAGCIFSRVFPVYNPPEKEGKYETANMKNPGEVKNFNFKDYRKDSQKRKAVNMDFYPEGGRLVDGLSSTLAFRITDKTGKAISANGEIRSPQGERLTEFSTLHQGMGRFHYTPDGQKNKAVVHYDKKEYTFPLPVSLDQGYVMQINNFFPSSVLVQIEKSLALPPQTLGLTVMCRGNVSVFETMEIGENPRVIKIPKESLHSGVNQVTLFDSKGEVFAERQLFIHPQPDEAVSVKLTSGKETYEPREKIKLDFEVSGGRASVLSVAVRDAGTMIATADAGNLLSNMLLSSDLKGFIENPGYYFASDSPDRIQALDLLLLVHGWKRYEWEPMAGAKTFHLRHPMEKGLLITGQVVGNANEVNLIMGEADKIMDGMAPVDSLRHFSIYAEDFAGSWLLTMTAPGLKDAYKNIRLDRWFSPPPKCYFPDEIQTSHPDLQFRQQEDSFETKEQPIISPIKTDMDSIGTQYEIDELEVAGIKRGKDLIYNVAQEVEEWLDKGRKYYPDIVHEYLVEKNSGYVCKGLDPNMPGDNNIYYSYRPFFGNYKVYMMCVVNGKAKSLYDRSGGGWQIIAVVKNILEVEKIVIMPWNKKTVYSRIDNEIGVFHPVLVYPLKNYRLTIQVMRNARQTLFEGYSKVQEFSSGIYMPGVREHYRTLYWNPSLRSDDEGKASIEFYNTQFGREIEIDACGITGEGDLVY
jgi:hypothetical protein